MISLTERCCANKRDGSFVLVFIARRVGLIVDRDLYSALHINDKELGLEIPVRVLVVSDKMRSLLSPLT